MFLDLPGHLPLAGFTLVVLDNESLVAGLETFDGLLLFCSMTFVEYACNGGVNEAVLILVFANEHKHRHRFLRGLGVRVSCLASQSLNSAVS